MNTLHTPTASRRDFITRSAQVAAAGLLGSAFGAPSAATSETLVQQLYGSMDEAPRKTLCFGWSDPRRLKARGATDRRRRQKPAGGGKPGVERQST